MFGINSRVYFLLSWVAVLGLLLFALYLQYFQNLLPCPLCMLQRVVFILIGAVALIAYIHNPHIFGMRIYGIINSLLSIMGLALASRHVWLENLPPGEVPDCGPSLEAMLEYLPIFEALKNAIMGSGECAKIDWTFMGLSIAMWSLICFAGFLIVNLSIMFKPVGRF